jgi:hypothetical protein
MTVISYSASDSQIYGLLTLNDVVGQFEYKLVDALRTDINSVVTLNPEAYFLVFGDLIPILKIVSDISAFSFVGRPEPAYKFGSFSWVKGYSEIIFEDGSISLTPIPYASEYIIYPLQTFKSAKVILRYPEPLDIDYGIDFGDDAVTTSLIRTIDTRTINSAYGLSAYTACGLLTNIPTGIVAKIKMFYSLRLFGVGLIDNVGNFQPVLI